MIQELQSLLEHSAVGHCRVLTARDARSLLGLNLNLELEAYAHLQKRPHGSHGDRDVWMMPVDFELLSSAHFVVGSPRSTFSSVTGAATGQLFVGSRGDQFCWPIHEQWPQDDLNQLPKRGHFAALAKKVKGVHCSAHELHVRFED
jgi:hypothetical protein